MCIIDWMFCRPEKAALRKVIEAQEKRIMDLQSRVDGVINTSNFWEKRYTETRRKYEELTGRKLC